MPNKCIFVSLDGVNLEKNYANLSTFKVKDIVVNADELNEWVNKFKDYTNPKSSNVEIQGWRYTDFNVSDTTLSWNSGMIYLNRYLLPSYYFSLTYLPVWKYPGIKVSLDTDYAVYKVSIYISDENIRTALMKTTKQYFLNAYMDDVNSELPTGKL